MSKRRHNSRMNAAPHFRTREGRTATGKYRNQSELQPLEDAAARAKNGPVVSGASAIEHGDDPNRRPLRGGVRLEDVS